MKKVLALLWLLQMHSIDAICQEEIKVWGRISQGEVDLTVYEQDPEAEAVVLFDVGSSAFFYSDREGYLIRFTRRKRIKILEDSGIKFGEIAIPIYKDGYGKTERLLELEAVSYNIEDGKLIKNSLALSDVFEEKVSESWYEKKFAVPNVKEGTIFEIKYEIETPFLFNLPDWEFQGRIPTIYSQYSVSMIPFYEYTYIAQGLSNFDVYDSKMSSDKQKFGSFEFNNMIYTYGMKNIPAFKDESYITSINDYIIKLDFQLAKINRPTGGTEEIMSTWPDLIERLTKHEDFGKYIKKSESISKIVLEELGGNPTSQQIIEYVKNSFTWNRHYSKYASKSPKELLSQKTGNSADLNLFLVSLLTSAGFEAKPVIISTRGHGKIKSDYPFSHYFNNVIVIVQGNNGYFLTDATENLLGYDRIPVDCINETGLIISENKESVNWIQLDTKVISSTNSTINFKVSPEKNAMETTINITSTEFDAHYFRKKIQDDSLRWIDYLKNNGIHSINKIRFMNYNKLQRPYSMIAKGETGFEQIDNQLIILPFLKFPESENDLKQKSRSYPVDFTYASSEEFISLIEFPSDYKLVSFPKDFSLNSDLGELKIESSVDLEGTSIKITGKYLFKKAVYQPAEYTQLKNYFDIIIRKFNEPVVLEKI